MYTYDYHCDVQRKACSKILLRGKSSAGAHGPKSMRDGMDFDRVFE